jgi:hypothetical protein
MKKLVSLLLAGMLLFVQSGCATIVSSSDQEVRVMSDPPGAKVRVDGMLRGVTPTIFDLERKRRHQIQIEKEGYETVVRDTGKGFNWWFTGNILFGGIIGMIIDFANGSVYKVKPNEINVVLQAIEGYVPPPAKEAVLTPVPVPGKIPDEVDKAILQVEKPDELRKKGLISNEEFNVKKKELLGL